MTQTKVLIIGAGEIGKAIGKILEKGGKSEVKFWDNDPNKVSGGGSLENLAERADVVFFAVPSKAVRQVLENICKVIKREVPVVVLAKGIEAASGQTMDEVMQKYLRRSQIALLYGPMIAEELMSGLSSGAVLACKSNTNAKKIVSIFNDELLRLYYSPDVHGVAVTGVLKNIYSIGLGIVHGLNLGANFRGWYVSQACKEIAKIVKKSGGKINTAYEQAGVGDLVATGFSHDSRNHQVGLDYTKEKPSGMTSEGTNSIGHVYAKFSNRAEFPILSILHEIIVEKKPAKDIFPKVISR